MQGTRVPLIIIGAMLMAAASCVSVRAREARFVAFNSTTSTDFSGLYLAPAGTDHWGPNQVLNEKDKSWEASERIRLSDIKPGRYDARLVDEKGRECRLSNVDLTKDTSFEVRDADLASCH